MSDSKYYKVDMEDPEYKSLKAAPELKKLDKTVKIISEICEMQERNYGNGTKTHIELIALSKLAREILASLDKGEK